MNRFDFDTRTNGVFRKTNLWLNPEAVDIQDDLAQNRINLFKKFKIIRAMNEPKKLKRTRQRYDHLEFYRLKTGKILAVCSIYESAEQPDFKSRFSNTLPLYRSGHAYPGNCISYIAVFDSIGDIVKALGSPEK